MSGCDFEGSGYGGGSEGAARGPGVAVRPMRPRIRGPGKARPTGGACGRAVAALAGAKRSVANAAWKTGRGASAPCSRSRLPGHSDRARACGSSGSRTNGACRARDLRSVPREGDVDPPESTFRERQRLSPPRLHCTAFGAPRRDAAGRIVTAILLPHATTGRHPDQPGMRVDAPSRSGSITRSARAG